MNHSATYSPEDNKLRITPAYRLDKDEYSRVKAAGFSWAPKQGIFVAPMWTPEREDLAVEMCGSIEDEDRSLMDRAEDRAERFEDYSDKRTHEADRARKAVSAITDNIPLGQPILIGHHSEKRARRDAERIENGMRRAVGLWETAQYWKSRAASAIAHAKYKELPSVRARRIKTIEAEQRKKQRSKAEAEQWLKAWSQEGLTHEQAMAIASRCWLNLPRKAEDRQGFNGNPTAYDALTNSYPSLYAPRTVEEIVTHALKVYPRTIAWCDRWISHYANRLEYERAMLAESGGTVTDKTGPEKGGACRCWASPRSGWSYIQKVNKISVTVLDNWGNGGANFTRTIPFDKLSKIMTKAEVDAAREAGRLIDIDNGRGFVLAESGEREETPAERADRLHREHLAKFPEPEPTAFDAMKATLAAGVQVMTAPQLFPTPKELAQQIADLAEIEPGQRILEPSAGTGVLIGACGGRMFGHHPERGECVAVEINPHLAERLKTEFPKTTVHTADFLTCNGNLGTFDRIVMNPPFQNGEDIKHILHARHMLNPGGRLVALCANGPRQQEALQPLAAHWEALPAGSFKDEGTMVNVALLIIDQDEPTRLTLF